MRRANSKRRRYEAVFTEAARILAEGKSVFLRPEEADGSDARTIMNYWYSWRRLYFGMYCKSPDDNVRRRATVVIDCGIRFDTDDDGRVVLRIMPFITPPKMLTEHAVQTLTEPETTGMAFSTGQGSSAPTAPPEEANYHLAHTKPWQDWFRSITDTDGLFACLDDIPAEMRANSDFGAIDDLPAPDSPEGAAWKARFRTLLEARGQTPA